MIYKAKVGDIWEGKSNNTWDSNYRFQIDKINGKTAKMRSIMSGDITSITLDFVKLDSWRLIKRAGRKTRCVECQHTY